MRFVFNDEMKYGVVNEDQVRIIEGWPNGPYTLLEESIPLTKVKPLAPLMPGKVVAVGLNYASHVAEMKVDRPAPTAPRRPSTPRRSSRTEPRSCGRRGSSGRPCGRS